MNGEEGLGENFISIRTVRDFYSPGENVHGYITLRLVEDLKASSLELKIKGKEYTYWLDHKINLRMGAINNAELDAAHKANEIEGKVIFYNHKFEIFSWKNNIIPKGDYMFPFEFVLKDYLPGKRILHIFFFF